MPTSPAKPLQVPAHFPEVPSGERVAFFRQHGLPALHCTSDTGTVSTVRLAHVQTRPGNDAAGHQQPESAGEPPTPSSARRKKLEGVPSRRGSATTERGSSLPGSAAAAPVTVPDAGAATPPAPVAGVRGGQQLQEAGAAPAAAAAHAASIPPAVTGGWECTSTSELDSTSGRQDVTGEKPADEENGRAPGKDAAGSPVQNGAVETPAASSAGMQLSGQGTSSVSVSAAGQPVPQAPGTMHERSENPAEASTVPASSAAELAPPLHAGLQQPGGIPFGSQFDVTMGVEVFEQLGDAVPAAMAGTAGEMALGDQRDSLRRREAAAEVAAPVQPVTAGSSAGVWQDADGGQGTGGHGTGGGPALRKADAGPSGEGQREQHARKSTGAAAAAALGAAASGAEAGSAPQISAYAALPAENKMPISIPFGPAIARVAATAESANPFGAADTGEDDEAGFFAELGSAGRPLILQQATNNFYCNSSLRQRHCHCTMRTCIPESKWLPVNMSDFIAYAVLRAVGGQAVQPALAQTPAAAPWEQPGPGEHVMDFLGTTPMPPEAATDTPGASALPAQEQLAQPAAPFAQAPDQAREQQQAAWGTQDWPPQQVMF